MNLFVCCVAILAVASVSHCLSDSEELMAVKLQMLKDYMSESEAVDALTEKVETICPGYGRKFKTALQKTQQCAENIDETQETMCSLVNNHFRTCFSPMVKVFEECLPEKSKDIPAFAVDSFLSVTNYLCKTDGEHIFELSNTCFRTQNHRTRRCIRKVQNTVQQYNNKFPSKEETCEAFTSLRGCLESHLYYSCGNVKTREAVLNVFDAATNSCKPKIELNEIEVLEPKRLYVGQE